MIDFKTVDTLIFFCMMLSMGACVLYGTLLYINIKMLSYFENELKRIETVLDGCVMYKDERR